MLPDPTPTAGTEPTSFPVAVSLLPNTFPDVAVSTTMLGSSAVDVGGAASWTVKDGGVLSEETEEEDAVEAARTFEAVTAWRRCRPNAMGVEESSIRYRACGLCSCRTTLRFLSTC